MLHRASKNSFLLILLFIFLYLLTLDILLCVVVGVAKRNPVQRKIDRATPWAEENGKLLHNVK